jgi:hypothetical protein
MILGVFLALEVTENELFRGKIVEPFGLLEKESLFSFFLLNQQNNINIFIFVMKMVINYHTITNKTNSLLRVLKIN